MSEPRTTPTTTASKSQLASAAEPRKLPPTLNVTAIAEPVRRLVPYANYAAQRLGHVGIVGLALCAFSVVMLMTAIEPLRVQLEADRQALEELRAEDRSADAVLSGSSGGSQLQTFIAALPTRKALAGLTGAVLAVSQSNGLELERGTYQFVPAATGSGIDRYRLSFPMRGTYPQVRQFVEGALVAVPSMALAGLRLERDSVSEQLVSAEVQFEVFVRSQP